VYSGDRQSKSLAQTAIPGVFDRQTKLDVAVLASVWTTTNTSPKISTDFYGIRCASNDTLR
jgi:hypothetical protein